jgi:hypothetical protein
MVQAQEKGGKKGPNMWGSTGAVPSQASATDI